MLQQVCYTYFALTKKLQTCYFINLDTKDTLTCEHINNKHNDLLYLDEKQKSQSKMGKFPLGKMDHNSNIVQVLKYTSIIIINMVKTRIVVQLTST